MSKELTPDIVEKDYWRNNDQFADLFNAVLFNGEFVIQSDSLEELDTEESQQLVHYAMPMRVMGYDYLAYKKQYDSNAIKYAGKEKRKESGLTTDEFFSRMKQTDKFAPVITLVIYYGDKAWDGAKRLHEMLEIPPRLLPFVSDYTLNLVEARNNSFIFHNKNNKDFRLEGKAEGTELMAKLVATLLQQNRIEDVKKVTGDKEYRDKLLEEFDLV